MRQSDRRDLPHSLLLPHDLAVMEHGVVSEVSVTCAQSEHREQRQALTTRTTTSTEAAAGQRTTSLLFRLFGSTFTSDLTSSLSQCANHGNRKQPTETPGTGNTVTYFTPYSHRVHTVEQIFRGVRASTVRGGEPRVAEQGARARSAWVSKASDRGELPTGRASAAGAAEAATRRQNGRKPTLAFSRLSRVAPSSV